MISFIPWPFFYFFSFFKITIGYVGTMCIPRTTRDPTNSIVILKSGRIEEIPKNDVQHVHLVLICLEINKIYCILYLNILDSSFKYKSC
jgi:hypothetical protein